MKSVERAVETCWCRLQTVVVALMWEVRKSGGGVIPSQIFGLSHCVMERQGFLGDAVVKNLPADAGDAGDAGLIPGSGRSPGGGHGHPLQYFCLEKLMDRGAWWAAVHEVSKSQTRLSMQVQWRDMLRNGCRFYSR